MRVSHLSWRDAALVAVPVVLIVALAFLVAARFVKPAPPDRLTMATGPAGGAYQQFAAKYRDLLRKNGVTLELKPSAGSVENLARLRAGEVDVALVQGGIFAGSPGADADGEPPIVSLGAMYPEPLWLFLNGARTRPIERLADLGELRMAVGPEGSGTRAFALDLLRVAGIDSAKASLSPLSGDAGGAALVRGDIDALFVVAGVDAPLVAQLLGRPDVRLADLAQSGALARQFSFVRPVSIPRGLVSLRADLPPRDVQTVAVTANLLARNALHPALMYLLLEAAADVHGRHTLLADAGTFPNASQQDAPLAEEAQRFYRQGKPFLQRYLPYWLANWVDRMLVLLIPILAVLVPAIKFLPDLYTYRLKAKVSRCYAALRALEAEIGRTPDPASVPGYLLRLDAIEADVDATKLPNWFAEQGYALRAAIDLVRERLGQPTAKAIPGLRQ
jgi:TRAP transporter TAXI family solute receptor